MNTRTERFSPSNWDPQTGDFVSIVKPTSPRAYCPLAPLVKLNFVSDTVARSAEVRTASGNLICPFVKLARILAFPIRLRVCFHKCLIFLQNWPSNWHFLFTKAFALLVPPILHVKLETKTTFFVYFHFFVSRKNPLRYFRPLLLWKSDTSSRARKML